MAHFLHNFNISYIVSTYSLSPVNGPHHIIKIKINVNNVNDTK